MDQGPRWYGAQFLGTFAPCFVGEGQRVALGGRQG